MASSSSSSVATSQPGINYDVFLSFRGEDTRDGFTDHLYTALIQAGIRTFRDDTMERGRMLGPELEKAIHESAVSLIVFSESFASSSWCLDEVTMIVEDHETSSSKHQFIPVFYKVDPFDVRNQKGSFKNAFDAYDDEIKAETNLEKKRQLLEKVEAWRVCLDKVATFTGLVYKDGYESKFITNIVNDVIKKVDYKALHIDHEKLVGIKYHLDYINNWLQDPSPDAVVLLIDGMGGIGKSTIARCIFNFNFRNYDGSCFLANVNETSTQPGGLLRLQSQLLSTLMKSNKEETIWNDYEGTTKVTNAIANKKVLLILDDVATLKQLDTLLGPKRFYPGSKLIITTRHKELSTAFTVLPKVLSVAPLETGDAIELFSLYAFDQDQPMEPYIVQSKLLADHCMGLPLALKVLGSSLRGKEIDEWEETMHQLAENPETDPEIQDVLEISYKSLKRRTDKELFLHIACFFEGEKKDYIVKLLAACDLYPLVGIKNLIDRCLVYVDEYGKVKMHQLIKEMGREVVNKESENEPGKRSRLWRHEDCNDVLQDQSGTKKVVGLMFDMRKIKEAEPTTSIKMNNPGKRSFEEYVGKTIQRNDADFKIGALEKMKNVMLLQINFVTFSGKWKKLPERLRLLRWHGCPLKAIPSDISLAKLVVLDMSHSKLTRVWDDFKFIESLKILNLSYSVELIKTPNFHGLLGLESLILKGCSSLIKVHESIAYLKELLLLDLTDCTKLRAFPCFPTSLVSLQLSGCEVLQLIQNLNSVPSFSLLGELNLSYCNLFDNSFPSDWSSMFSLKKLNISGNNVTSLPKCIQGLPTIQVLWVRNCSNIQTIRYLPKSLTKLYAAHNNSLEKVELTQNRLTTVEQAFCEKLCEIEGRYKIRSIDKVERKIIRYLGLELHADKGMELGLKVLHEFGIFSTCVSGKLIPSASGFMYRETGPQISFVVPRHGDSLRVSGFNMCVVLSQSSRYHLYCTVIGVYNKTKNLTWRYLHDSQSIPKNGERYAWLSVWRCGNLLETGDEIIIHIDDIGVNIKDMKLEYDNLQSVEECGINLLYGDDDQLDGETKEARDVNMFDQISWSDRMHYNISDYVYSGSTITFWNSYTEPQISEHQIKHLDELNLSSVFA